MCFVRLPSGYRCYRFWIHDHSGGTSPGNNCLRYADVWFNSLKDLESLTDNLSMVNLQEINLGFLKNKCGWSGACTSENIGQMCYSVYDTSPSMYTFHYISFTVTRLTSPQKFSPYLYIYAQALNSFSEAQIICL